MVLKPLLPPPQKKRKEKDTDHVPLLPVPGDEPVHHDALRLPDAVAASHGLDIVLKNKIRRDVRRPKEKKKNGKEEPSVFVAVKHLKETMPPGACTTVTVWTRLGCCCLIVISTPPPSPPHENTTTNSQHTEGQPAIDWVLDKRATAQLSD